VNHMYRDGAHRPSDDDWLASTRMLGFVLLWATALWLAAAIVAAVVVL
jgi:hypothetical protein